MSVIGKFFKIKTNNEDFCTAIIVAAGNSQRMGRDKKKVSVYAVEQ